MLSFPMISCPCSNVVALQSVWWCSLYKDTVPNAGPAAPVRQATAFRTKYIYMCTSPAENGKRYAALLNPAVDL